MHARTLFVLALAALVAVHAAQPDAALQPRFAEEGGIRSFFRNLFKKNPPAPDQTKKEVMVDEPSAIGIEVEFKPTEPNMDDENYSIDFFKYFVWTDADYSADEMPNVNPDAAHGVWELDIERQGEVEITPSGAAKITGLRAWAIEVLFLSKKDTLKADVEGDLAASATSTLGNMKTLAGGASKTCDLGNSGELTMDAYVFEIDQGGKKKVIVEKDFFDKVEAYTQANVDMTVERYMEKIEMFVTDEIYKKTGKGEMEEVAYHGISVGKLFKATYDNYKAMLTHFSDGADTLTPFQKFVVWVIANVGGFNPTLDGPTVAAHIGGVSGRFKNPFGVMPKMHSQELAKHAGFANKAALKTFLDKFNIPVDATAHVSIPKPKKKEMVKGVEVEISHAPGMDGNILTTTGPTLKQVFDLGRAATGDFWDMPAYSKQMMSESGTKLLTKLGKKGWVIGEYRYVQQFLHIDPSQAGETVSLAVTKYEKAKLF